MKVYLKKFDYFFISLLVLALIAPIFYKVHFIKNNISYLLGCKNCVIFPILSNDSMIYSLILFFAYLSVKYENIFSQIIFRFFSLIIFFVYVSDIFILKNFYTHLTANDAIKYIDQVPSFINRNYINNTSDYYWWITIWAILGSLLSTIHFFISPLRPGKLHRNSLWIVSLFLAIFYLSSASTFNIHKWIYQNVFEYNFMLSDLSTKYSPQLMANLTRANELDKKDCIPKSSGTKNIIVVAVESLSMYHSDFFSKLNNVTPNIDSIAKNNVSFSNFYANGFITEHGLIAIISGLPPINAPENYTLGGGVSFAGFFNTVDSLPKVLTKSGYTSEFLTTGNLKFDNKRKWLKSVGFNYIEGYEHPYYSHWERNNFFQAAPDEALYDRAMDRIFNQKRDKPYLMFIETVSTHHPYINPENNERSEFGAFKYADKALGQFYDHLKKGNFFDSGILIITSDHRSMTPLRKEELHQYGSVRAPARIPLIISFGKDVSYIETQPFQQTDLYASIINYTSKKSCTSKWQGDLFVTPSIPPEFIIHQRGDNRNIISIFWQDRNLRIKLNGDKTDVINATIEKKVRKELVDKINYERILRGNNKFR